MWASRDPSGSSVHHERIVLDTVEEPVQIDIDDEGLARFDRPSGRIHGLMGALVRTDFRGDSEVP